MDIKNEKMTMIGKARRKALSKYYPINDWVKVVDEMNAANKN